MKFGFDSEEKTFEHCGGLQRQRRSIGTVSLRLGPARWVWKGDSEVNRNQPSIL